MAQEEQKTSALPRLRLLGSSWKEILPDEAPRTLSATLLHPYPLQACDSLQLASASIWCQHRPEETTFVCGDNVWAMLRSLQVFEAWNFPGERVTHPVERRFLASLVTLVTMKLPQGAQKSRRLYRRIPKTVVAWKQELRLRHCLTATMLQGFAPKRSYRAAATNPTEPLVALLELTAAYFSAIVSRALVNKTDL
jgi:hypothetical protein